MEEGGNSQGTHWTLSDITAFGLFKFSSSSQLINLNLMFEVLGTLGLGVTHGREELFVSRLDTDMSWSEVHADAAGDPEDLQAEAG